MNSLPPLGAYVHIPWCVRKCPYCDFNSHAAGPTLPEADYLAALRRDLEQELPNVAQRPLRSIFFGGGTPSLFSPAAIGEILNMLERNIGFTDDIEITLEANPGTFEQEKFKAYRQLGVNRLSIGVQSFNSTQLKALGRIHNGEEALRAADMARKAGFDNLNLDLMHGLPEQSLDDALHDLELAIAQNPTHLSWYQLTVEPNTVFWSKPPELPEDDILWDIQEAGQALLAKHGFKQYETSAYAQEGFIARHNLNYWTFGDFIGIGAGAHGKITYSDGRIERHWKTRTPKDYMNEQRILCAGATQLPRNDLPFEFLMNALRLTQGVRASLFTERTGLSFSALEPAYQQAIQRGLLENDPERLQATLHGQLFLNDLLQLFMTEPEK